MKRLSLLFVLVSFIGFNANAQLSKKLLEKAAKAKAKSMEVKTEGDQGIVYVYKDAARTQKVTDLSGLLKVYCTAHIHPGAAKNASLSSSSLYGIWTGAACGLNGGSPCEKYYEAGGERVIEKNQMNGKGKAKVETLDFEIDLVEAVEYEVTNDKITGESEFFIPLTNGKSGGRNLAISEKLTFDIKGKRKVYEAAIIKRNERIKIKEDLYASDTKLHADVARLLKSTYGIASFKKNYFYKDWTTFSNGTERKLKAMVTRKEGNRCLVSFYNVWSKLLTNGQWSAPTAVNQISNNLVDCKKIQ